MRLWQRCQTCRTFPEGLMFIAPNLENKDDLRPYFKKMNDKFNELKTKNIDHVEIAVAFHGDER